MDRKRLSIPRRGASNATAFIEEPGDVAPVEILSNVRVFDSTEGRARGGVRESLERLFPGTIGSGDVQALKAISLSSQTTGYNLGDQTLQTSGTSFVTGFHSGNFWRLDAIPSIEIKYTVDVTGDGGPAAQAVNAVCYSRDGTKVFACCNYSVASEGRSQIDCYDCATNNRIWSHTIKEPGVNRFVNTMVAGNEYLFVCTNKYIRCVRIDTGAAVGGNEYDLSGWSSETIEAVVVDEEVGNPITAETETLEFLYVAFDGATAAGTRHGGGAIDTGIYAANFRAGVMKMGITTIANLPNVGPTNPGINITRWSTVISSTSPFYESDHRYFRISEKTAALGFGCRVKAMRATPDGGLVVARTNQGWGPTSAYRPSPTEPSPDSAGVPTGNPFVSVFKISKTGVLEWENNSAESITNNPSGEGAYAGHPHFNDIITPSFEAIAVAADGSIFVAGRQNQYGYSVYCLEANGSPRWRANVVPSGGTAQVFQAAAAVDPNDGNVWLGGVRNNVWDGSDPDGAGPMTPQDAHLFKLDALTGRNVGSFNLGGAVSALCVAVIQSGTNKGKLAYGTDFM